MNKERIECIGLNGCSFSWEQRRKCFLLVSRPAALMIIFHSPFPHLVIWTAQRSSTRCELTKRGKEVQWDSQNCSHLSKPSCLSCGAGHFPVTKSSSAWAKVCEWMMNNSGWRWVGSVQSMQGEISHWWPLTDGDLTALCNADPREYQVSPHYTLHRVFQLQRYPLWLEHLG